MKMKVAYNIVGNTFTKPLLKPNLYYKFEPITVDSETLSDMVKLNHLFIEMCLEHIKKVGNQGFMYADEGVVISMGLRVNNQYSMVAHAFVSERCNDRNILIQGGVILIDLGIYLDQYEYGDPNVVLAEGDRDWVIKQCSCKRSGELADLVIYETDHPETMRVCGSLSGLELRKALEDNKNVIMPWESYLSYLKRLNKEVESNIPTCEAIVAIVASGLNVDASMRMQPADYVKFLKGVDPALLEQVKKITEYLKSHTEL